VLKGTDATERVKFIVRTSFASVLRDRSKQLFMLGDSLVRQKQVRLLEKTPKNALRIAFLKEVFPDARFLFLYREPRGNIASLIDGWNADRRFESYEMPTMKWKFILPQGWESLKSLPIPWIAATQWHIANEAIITALRTVDKTRWHFVRYCDLVDHASRELCTICEFADIDPKDLERDIRGPLPLSRSILTPPHRDKWKRHEKVIREIMPTLEEMEERVEKFVGKR
jgi:hypothetical protein